MTSLRFAVETLAFRVALACTRILPRPVTRRLGAAAGGAARFVDRRHTRIALRNLDSAYGDTLDARHKRRIVRSCWRHFGRTVADSLWCSRLDADGLGALVDYEGLEHIRRAYRRGRGVLLFSAHFGHWELTALMQGYLGMPLALIARPLDNPRLETLLARLRDRSGNRVIHKRQAVREALRALRRAEGVAIVLDQDARGSGVFVPFFGRPASTTPTLALLALRSGAAVVPTYSLPLPDGRYRIVYEPILELRPTGDRDRDVQHITATCTSMIEGWVRRHPELWLWMHRRWKTRPDIP